MRPGSVSRMPRYSGYAQSSLFEENRMGSQKDQVPTPADADLAGMNRCGERSPARSGAVFHLCPQLFNKLGRVDILLGGLAIVAELVHPSCWAPSLLSG